MNKNKNNRFNCLLDNKPKDEQIKKRREHINFKIEIKQKLDIDIFIQFLIKDIKRRLKIDKKYSEHYNECHLKHLNFIIMEILLHRVLCLYYKNYFIDEQSDDDNDIQKNILYIPEENYEKILTQVEIEDIRLKYKMIQNNEELSIIAQEVYDKYKSFNFINLNFLKRKIYEYI